MSDRIGWITYKGQKILRVDYSGLQNDYQEFLRIIKQIPTFYKGQSKASVLSVVNVRDVVGCQQVMDGLKSLIPIVHEYDKKAAVLGISGIKKALLVTLNMFTGHAAKPFDSEQEALDWLVS